MALLAFAQLIVSVDYNIVYVALPEIGDGLGFSGQTLQWVVSAYAVAFGGVLLFGGRAADLFGRRRMFVLGLLLYALSSLVGGLATTPGLLVAARAVQGLGGAFLFPATLSLVNTTFAEGRQRNHALSIWAAAGASGMILGSLLGGALTHAFGWEAVFFVNVPLAGGAVALAFVLIAPDGERGTARSFDLPGAVTATLGATLLVFTLVQGPELGWTSPLVLISGLAGLLLIALFLVIESRSQDPLMPLRLLRNRNMSTGVVTTFLFMATFGTLLYFLTVYFQNVQGYSAMATGIAFLAPMTAGFVGSMLGGRLATRFGTRRTMVVAYVVGAISTAAVGAVMSTDGTYGEILPGFIVLSVCQGVIFSTMFAAAATGVVAEEQGIASGVVSTGQQFGSALGLAVLVAVANSGTSGLTGEALRSATADGLRTAVLVASAGILALILVALNFRIPKITAAQDTPEGKLHGVGQSL
ncbi:MFS transporter [Sphaerimonospora thailandensis]|uniref:MFS transporter n=1 Tax=Sphaerimonospora thailandensis TaxID=795644 RepID=A0A8J3R4T6_9ACTN|nr:MFS transporter [Sphaerimonospora thailandensis]GIH67979.1 MFS transporter [Sphaerimonospora thailandensis]